MPTPHQVYLLEHKGTIDITGGFRTYTDIEKSLRLTYSQWKHVHIKTTDKSLIAVLFSNNANALTTDEYKIHRLPIWDSPTYL